MVVERGGAWEEERKAPGDVRWEARYLVNGGDDVTAARRDTCGATALVAMARYLSFSIVSSDYLCTPC